MVSAVVRSLLSPLGVLRSFVAEVPDSLIPMSGLMGVKVQTPDTSSSAPPSFVGIAGGSGKK